MIDSREEKDRFKALLIGLSDYYKSEISKAVAKLYWQGLIQYDYEAIEKAAWAHMGNPDEAGRWFPRIADLRKILEGSTVDQSMIAWSKVDTAVRVRGSYDDLVFDDPIIHRVIADMGGWVLVAGKDDKEYPFVAKEFQQRYRAYRQQGVLPDYPPRLTGMANAHNASQGRPLLPAILIGDQEKAKKVIHKQLGSDALKIGA